MEAREPGRIGVLHEREAILQYPLRGRAGDVLDVVENPEGRRHPATLGVGLREIRRGPG